MDSCSVRWGTALTGGGKSGLGFAERGGLPTMVPVTPVGDPPVPFLLGTLTHFNRPVAIGTAATGAKLNLSVTLDIPPMLTRPFDFSFTIDETLNSPPCTYPSTTPCADKITFSAPPPSSFFSIGGVDYTLTLLGFSTDGGTTIASEVITQEGRDTPIDLYAALRARRDVTTPTPGAFSLLGLGLVGIGALRRRRK